MTNAYPPDFLFAGRYRGLQQVGAGGMARVYRAEDTVLGRTVALKILAPELAGDPAFLERFQREARAAAQLVHPNIVTVFDVGAVEDQQFLVMEYVDGRDLKQLLVQHGRPPPDVVVAVGVQVCAGLAFAHERGIIHRDIKPQNLLVPGRAGNPPLGTDGFGQVSLSSPAIVKITDFGIARALGAASLSRTGELLGSVHYLAPELAQSQPASFATDIYALGVVLYELLMGTVPFQADTPIGVVFKHINEAPVPLRQQNPALPAWLEDVVQQALAKDPAARFPSAAAMGKALMEGARPSIDVTQRTAAPTAAGAAAPPRRRPPAPPIREAPQEPPETPRSRRLGRRAATGVLAFSLIVGGLLLFSNLLPRLFPSVVREYPERRADGSLWQVRQYSNGTFQDTLVATPAPTATATPTSTPTPTPTPRVLREYTEQRADGSVWLVRAWSDGRYEDVRQILTPRKTETFNFMVRAREAAQVALEIAGDSPVNGEVRVSGAGNDIRFTVTGPDRKQAADFGVVRGAATFKFQTQQRGTYAFVLDNGFSLVSSKSVSLTVTYHPAGG